MSRSKLTLINLENSRAFRISWLLEELGLEYENKVFPRINGKKAPQEMHDASGTVLNKSPAIIDHGPPEKPFEKPVTVWESCAIILYLIERYGSDSTLLPTPPARSSESSTDFDWQKRSSILAWLNFAESLMTHSLPVIYQRWFTREDVPGDQEAKEHMEESLSANVTKDLDAIDAQLKENYEGGKELYLVGDELSVADIMMAFSVEYVISMQAGTKGKTWPMLERWLEQLEQRPAYQKALKNGAEHKFCLLK